MRNIPLQHNPNPRDNEKNYLRPQPSEYPIRDFGKRKDGWRIHKDDKEKVDKIINPRKKKK